MGDGATIPDTRACPWLVALVPGSAALTDESLENNGFNDSEFIERFATVLK